MIAVFVRVSIIHIEYVCQSNSPTLALPPSALYLPPLILAFPLFFRLEHVCASKGLCGFPEVKLWGKRHVPGPANVLRYPGA